MLCGMHNQAYITHILCVFYFFLGKSFIDRADIIWSLWHHNALLTKQNSFSYLTKTSSIKQNGRPEIFYFVFEAYLQYEIYLDVVNQKDFAFLVLLNRIYNVCYCFYRYFCYLSSPTPQQWLNLPRLHRTSLDYDWLQVTKKARSWSWETFDIDSLRAISNQK